MLQILQRPVDELSFRDPLLLLLLQQQQLVVVASHKYVVRTPADYSFKGKAFI